LRLRSAWFLACFVCLLVRPARAADRTLRFALVIGSNEAPQAKLDSLKYADDDAARNFELLSAFGVQATLVAALDADSQKDYPWAVPLERPPTLKAVTDAVNELLARVSQAHAAHHKVELYFWYTGHGTASGTQIALNLKEGAFTAWDLYQLISKSKADYNHVIIDACHASSLVGIRGEAATDAELERGAQAHDVPALASWPNYSRTGFVLARGGADNQTYEWSEYKAGVVSHAVRSALAGAADLSGDQEVSYDELAAFVAAANAQVVEQARPSIVVIPPRDALFLRLTAWSGRSDVARIRLRNSLHGHLFIEDKNGARLAEVDKDAGYRTDLFLPRRSEYYAMLDDRELASFSIAAGSEVDFTRLAQRSRPRGTATRGLRLDMALREGLFAAPYGRTFYLAFCQSPATSCRTLPPAVPDVSEDDVKSPNRTVPYVLLGSAVVAAGVGTGFYIASNKAFTHYENAPPDSREEWRNKTRSYDWAATISFCMAGAAGLVGGSFLVHELLTPQTTVAAGLGSIALKTTF
jgi:hypothetical protein